MQYNGLERIASESHLFRNRRLGLVTTASAVTSSLRSSVEVFSSLYDLRSLYAPEHGLYSDALDGDPIETCIDASTSLPVYSLYNHERESLTPAMVEGIDTLVFDIQDLGLRFYTYIATLKNLLVDASSLGLPVIVLDRPNPLGGMVVEGNILGKDSFSFVGPAALPIRYALSIGELALYLNSEEHIGCDLTVIPLVGWKRSMYFSDLKRPWVMTSPAIAHFSTALIYAGMCLFEGTNISEGRGTSSPFSLIGSPFLEPFSLTRMANGLGLAGVGFTPAHFTPTSSKYAHESCKGLYVHVLDRHQFRPVKTALSLINLMANQYPGEFSFLPSGKEGTMMSFERLAGKNTQVMLLEDLPQLLHTWEDESRLFAEQKQRFHLYQ